MKNNKILFLGQYFYPEKISSGVLPYELASELIKNNYEVTALVGKPKEYIENTKKIKKKEKFSGIKIRRVFYLQAKRSKIIGRIINILSFSISVFMHPFYFKNHDYYICYTNPPLLPAIAAFYARIFKKKLIIVVYDLYPDNAVKLGILKENSSIVKAFNKVYKFVFKTAYKVVTLSNEMKEYLIENKQLIATNIEVISNWYKSSDNIGLNNPSSNEKHIIRVLYGGNMGLAQDMDTLTEVIVKLNNNPNIEFLFAGHGVKKDEINVSLTKNNITNYKILAFLSKKEYDKLLSECDIAILTLNPTVWGLGSPSKYYGYLANRKPVIAIMPDQTDIVRDIKEYHHGVHILNGDSETLVEWFNEIIQDSPLLETMKQQSYKLFLQKYTLEICANKYINILNTEEK